jgi:uncharacterized membrane protein
MKNSISNHSYVELLSTFDSYEGYLREMVKVSDKLWWDRAIKRKSKNAYKEYLFNYPHGLYSSKAEEQIVIFEEKELEKELEKERLDSSLMKSEEQKEKQSDILVLIALIVYSLSLLYIFPLIYTLGIIMITVYLVTIVSAEEKNTMLTSIVFWVGGATAFFSDYNWIPLIAISISAILMFFSYKIQNLN